VHLAEISANQALNAGYEMRLNQMRVNSQLQLLLGSAAFDAIVLAHVLKRGHFVVGLHELIMIRKCGNARGLFFADPLFHLDTFFDGFDGVIIGYVYDVGVYGVIQVFIVHINLIVNKGVVDVVVDVMI
jgi:hypothetical protein